MYGLINRLEAVPGKRDELIALLSDGMEAMPGCLSYVVATEPNAPDVIWVTEVWESEDEHEQALGLPAVQEAIEKGRPLLHGKGEQTRIEPVAGLGLERAR